MTETPDQTKAVEYAPHAMRGDVDSLIRLQELAADGRNATADLLAAAELDDLGPNPEAPEIEEAADELILTRALSVERTLAFEIVLGTGGPDRRFIVECDAIREEMPRGYGQQPVVNTTYEPRRVLYRYSWDGSGEVELYGDDKEAVLQYAQRLIPEITEGERS